METHVLDLTQQVSRLHFKKSIIKMNEKLSFNKSTFMMDSRPIHTERLQFGRVNGGDFGINCHEA